MQAINGAIKQEISHTIITQIYIIICGWFPSHLNLNVGKSGVSSASMPADDPLIFGWTGTTQFSMLTADDQPIVNWTGTWGVESPSVSLLVSDQLIVSISAEMGLCWLWFKPWGFSAGQWSAAGSGPCQVVLNAVPILPVISWLLAGTKRVKNPCCGPNPADSQLIISTQLSNCWCRGAQDPDGARAGSSAAVTTRFCSMVPEPVKPSPQGCAAQSQSPKPSAACSVEQEPHAVSGTVRHASCESLQDSQTVLGARSGSQAICWTILL